MRESIGMSAVARRALCASGLVLASAMGVGLVGCAKPRVSDLDAYQVIPMNRVVPFPTDAELEKRVFEVAVIDRPAEKLDEQVLRKPRVQVRTGLEKIAASQAWNEPR